MKYLFFLMIIVISVRAQNEQDTLAVYQNGDTLFYNWTAFEETPFKPKFLTRYKGNIFLTYIHQLQGKTYYSDDFLNTWKEIKWIASNDTINVVDYCLLPNKRIVVSGNYYFNSQFTGSVIKVYNIETESWDTYRDNDFKDQRAANLVFRDSNTGILATLDSSGTGYLYRTENGGENWTEIYSCSENMFVDIAKYFENENTLMLVLQYYKDGYKKRYFRFSKDFGESWSELKEYPIDYKIYQSPSISDGFYMRNDSIWSAGSYKVGNYQNNRNKYNFIMFSPDMGDTWELLYRYNSPVLSSFTNIDFFDDSPIGIVCEITTSRLLITFDYGENWRVIGDPKYQNASYINPLDDKEYNRLYGIIKADNKMVVTGTYGIYVMNKLNVSTATGVSSSVDNSIFNVYYDNRNQIINIKSAESELIDRIELYTASGQALYSNNTINRPEYQIPSYEINNTKIVFAIIYSGNQMYLKKVLCE